MNAAGNGSTWMARETAESGDAVARHDVRFEGSDHLAEEVVVPGGEVVGQDDVRRDLLVRREVPRHLVDEHVLHPLRDRTESLAGNADDVEITVLEDIAEPARVAEAALERGCSGGASPVDVAGVTQEADHRPVQFFGIHDHVTAYERRGEVT